jgi:uncharacterized Tic20 family protein
MKKSYLNFALKFTVWSLFFWFLIFIAIDFVSYAIGFDRAFGFQVKILPPVFFYFSLFICVFAAVLLMKKYDNVGHNKKYIYLIGFAIWLMFGSIYLFLAYKYLETLSSTFGYLYSPRIGRIQSMEMTEYGILPFFIFMSIGWYFAWTRATKRFFEIKMSKSD